MAAIDVAVASMRPAATEMESVAAVSRSRGSSTEM